MKVTYAPWELRNLGIVVYEVDCEQTAVGEILFQVNQLKAEMVVCRLDISRSATLFEFAREGFVNVETTFSLRRLSKARFHRQSGSNIRSRELNDDEKAFVFSSVRSGIFQLDRISIDPRFSQLVAGQRMVNWLQDEVDQGGEMIGVFREGSLFAFFSFREIRKTEAHIALSGVIPTENFPGAGQLLQQSIIEKFAAKNITWINTKVSSNNLSALRSNLAAGFEIIAAEHILVQHR